MAELCGEDAIDLRLDHAAFLVCRHRRVVFQEPFAEDVRCDLFCGLFNEFWIRVDGLAEDIISLDSEFCIDILPQLKQWDS